MIDELKPYPEYKESGLSWLRMVPNDWKILRMKAVVYLNPRKSESVAQYRIDAPATFLPMEQVGTDGRIDASIRIPASQLWNGFTYYRKGDVLVAKITPCFENGKGACLDNLPTDIGFGSTEFHVLRPGKHLTSRFLFLLTRLHIFRDMGAQSMTGSAGQQRVPESFIAGYPAIIPPPDEQAAIVRFLDHANGKIERAIRAKRKLIALLNEQKQAIIHRAVTRGLDPNVKLKPSGVPWLGDVPEHWSVRRNAYLFDERNERGRPGLPILIVSLRTGITEGSTHDEDGRERRLIEDVTKYKFADKGDIAYNMMRMWQGAVGVVTTAGMVSPAYVVAKPRLGVLSAYFDHLFHTEDCKNEVNRHSRGIVTDRNRLYWDQFKRLYLPLPPLQEQQLIVAWIDRETVTLNAGIAHTEREISLLREYRTTLTADVVTGKLDVREAVKRLPAEAEQPLPPEERPDDLEDEDSEPRP